MLYTWIHIRYGSNIKMKWRGYGICSEILQIITHAVNLLLASGSLGVRFPILTFSFASNRLSVEPYQETDTKSGHNFELCPIMPKGFWDDSIAPLFGTPGVSVHWESKSIEAIYWKHNNFYSATHFRCSQQSCRLCCHLLLEICGAVKQTLTFTMDQSFHPHQMSVTFHFK